MVTVFIKDIYDIVACHYNSKICNMDNEDMFVQLIDPDSLQPQIDFSVYVALSICINK